MLEWITVLMLVVTLYTRRQNKQLKGALKGKTIDPSVCATCGKKGGKLAPESSELCMPPGRFTRMKCTNPECLDDYWVEYVAVRRMTYPF